MTGRDREVVAKGENMYRRTVGRRYICRKETRPPKHILFPENRGKKK